MKVKDIIETLKKSYNPEDSLVVATWDKEQFAPLLEENDDWAEIAQSCMDEVDWGWVTQDIIDHIQSFQYSKQYKFHRSKKFNKQGDA